MPIGGFAAIFTLLILMTLGSGYWLLLRANALARELETTDNDVVAGRSRPPGRRSSRTGVWIAGGLFALGCLGLAAFIVLYVSGAITPGWTANDPTVQRP